MKGHKASKGVQALLSCLAYSFCSVGMVLSNKAIATSGIKGVSLLLVSYQCLVAVVLVELARRLGYVENYSFSWDTVKKWVPVNIFFCLMLYTSFMALKWLNVPMVTVFKNIANIFIVSGDWYIFNQHVSSLTVASLAVMTIGALLTGGSDIAFDVRGYAWMLANCMTTAAYVLKMRHATSTIKLSRFGMVFYNNAIGLALMAPAAALSGEWRAATQSGLDLFSPWSLFINSFAGVVGIGLNFASLWCVGATSATTYAIVGSFNKIPTGIIGYLLFRSPITSQSAFFMFISLAGGFLYSWAKLLESAQERKGKVEEGGQEEDAGLLSDKGGQEEGASFLPSHSTVQPHSPPLRARKPSSEAYPV